MSARTLVRLTFANPASLIYLGLVGAAVAFATAVTLFDPDPGFVWALPALCAFPLILLVGLAHGTDPGGGGPTAWLLITELVLCVLVQSLALGTIVEASRGRLRRDTPRPPTGRS
ncbi:SCO4225 family membrane protein [Streptomyces sp. NPDC092307]|uniref:SCO4225 family membrane protein n=1 Tax=Streptomyces sp. NPDC092307 TaxID=3366013 RepID=UPI00380E15AD